MQLLLRGPGLLLPTPGPRPRGTQRRDGDNFRPSDTQSFSLSYLLEQMRNKLNFTPLSPQKPFKFFMETKLSPDK